jgi:glycosyltransferase involved in cell wall biosynthesis
MIPLSIIIPVYNTEEYVSRCIASCLHQENINNEVYEIIIVDDGSTDNSLDILRGFEKKYGNISVISQKNLKQGAARNNGLRSAQGEYIWFVDSDDWIEATAISDLLKYLNENKVDVLRVDAANCQSATGIGEIRPCYHVPHKLYSAHEALLENKFSSSVPSHVFKKDFLLPNGLFFVENIFYEDSEFMLRVFEALSTFTYLNKCLYNVLIRDNSTTRSRRYACKLDLVSVIEAHIECHERQKLSLSAQNIVAKHIGRRVNSLLSGTAASRNVFNEAVQRLRKIDSLEARVRQSRSIWHIAEFYMTKYPWMLRRLLMLYYRG